MLSFSRLVAAAFIAAATIVIPNVANADTSCDGLFNGLRASAGTAPDTAYVHLLWTTNYFVPEQNARFVATTQVNLRLSNGDLFGKATRHQKVYTADPTKPPVPVDDEVSVRIRADGKVMFNDQYGPFDPVCSREKFAYIDSSDSFEVFTFVFAGLTTANSVEVRPTDQVKVDGAVALINRPGTLGSTNGVTVTVNCNCTAEGTCSIVSYAGKGLICTKKTSDTCSGSCNMSTSTSGVAPTSIQ